ncbi:MAG: PTS sugar transporter subunit IIB [Erysipelotrichaceae bacterium]|nr:PTS sugar transporter subunit IIB [Erysipelotrichaceae bacterium]
MKVLLICASGLSTSILVNNMRQYAPREDRIMACSVSELSTYLNDADVILVGPQLRHQIKDIEDKAYLTSKIVALMDPKIYSRIDGEGMLEQARSLFVK